MKLFTILLVFGYSAIRLFSQPLSDPYTFSFPADVEMDTAAFQQNVVPAGSQGRITIDDDGHFRLGNGDRFRIAGVALAQAAMFPDSAGAVSMARRLRSLGVNCVRFTGFDYIYYKPISILADGSSTLGAGLDAEQLSKFDRFTHELRKNGIYFTLDFHSYWSPRPEDAVRQWDSTGWGSRMPLLFDEGIQRIHRGIMRLMLDHVNPYTQLAYKNDPALVYITVATDASLTAYWGYTQEVVRPARYGEPASGNVYLRHIDSLYHAWLKGKGLTTNAALNAAWTVVPQATSNQIQNPGFEDPFSTSWVLNVNTGDGAKAVMQTTEADKTEGAMSMRIRIGELDAAKNSTGIYLAQLLSNVQHLRRYRLSFSAKTTPEQGTREIGAIIYNGTFPYQSYGLQQAVTLTSSWKQFNLDFTSSVTDTATAALLFVMGNSMGDVYLDDVKFTEIGFPGLNAGESITNGTVKRHEIWNDAVSPKRAKSEADFYQQALTQFFDRSYRLVRDTIKSDVLLCPSARMLSVFDYEATKKYDVFTSSENRASETSVLADQYGGGLDGHVQNRFKGKAFVLGLAAISFPRQYQPEMGVFYPAYAGLHDWDGVFVGLWDYQARTGAARTDSAYVYEVFDKPHILALLPSTMAVLRKNEIAPSSRVVEIAHEQEALDHPRLHSFSPYSLTQYTDPRMSIFRRVHTIVDLQDEESFLPHLEVSQISSGVDPTALDAENEQIFWDATKELFRISTPNYVAVTGKTDGQIVNLPGVIVENSTQNERATITLASLTGSPLAESSSSLLTIASRALNEGAVWNANNTELTRWGAGPLQMQGIDARVTISAPSFDSLYVQPLGNDARPMGSRINIARSPTGRFSIALNTRQYATPWYRLEFSRVTSSIVDNEELAFDSHGPYTMTVIDLTGHVVMTARGEGHAPVGIDTLAAGLYIARVQSEGGTRIKRFVKY